MIVNAKNYTYSELNKVINKYKTLTISGVLGERHVATGAGGGTVTIEGVPGNALASYLNGATVIVKGDVQDAVGDTMNDGIIVVYGSAGDALGYSMRGGEIYVEKCAGYRVGIHMKEYGDKKPAIIIGGTAGSFLGEYQAGGVIVVLNLFGDDFSLKECGTGMHGGKMFVRGVEPKDLPEQVKCAPATENDIAEIKKFVENYCKYFGFDENKVLNSEFFVLRPNSQNPYKRLYCSN